MNMIKGDAPGEIYLDVKNDEYVSRLFNGHNPQLADLSLTFDFRETMDGHFRLVNPEIECEFRTARGRFPMTEATTHHTLTPEQVSRILDILIETSVSVKDVGHSRVPF